MRELPSLESFKIHLKKALSSRIIPEVSDFLWEHSEAFLYFPCLPFPSPVCGGDQGLRGDLELHNLVQRALLRCNCAKATCGKPPWLQCSFWALVQAAWPVGAGSATQHLHTLAVHLATVLPSPARMMEARGQSSVLRAEHLLRHVFSLQEQDAF